jgi:hypothetical protein
VDLWECDQSRQFDIALTGVQIAEWTPCRPPLAFEKEKSSRARTFRSRQCTIAVSVRTISAQQLLGGQEFRVEDRGSGRTADGVVAKKHKLVT